MVSRLQDEKRRLLKQQQSGSSSSESSPQHEITTSLGKPSPSLTAAQLAAMRTKASGVAADDKDTADVQVMQRLRLQLEKNRNEMKLKDIDLQAKTADVDNVSSFECILRYGIHLLLMLCVYLKCYVFVI